jgi:gliding motility-associated-like protein
VHDISWSFGDGYSDAGTTETAHTYTRSDVYKPVLFLRSDDKNTCNKAIVGNVVVHDLQATFAFDGGIDSGCVPFTPPLINNTLNADSYTWLQGNGGSSQEALPQLTYNQAGSYTLTLFAHYTPLGCVDSAKAAVTVFPLPEIDTSPDTLICLGDQLVLRADGGIEYLWSPALSLDNAAAATTVARPVFDTDYTVTVTDHNSCVDSAKVVVLVQQHPVVWLSDTTLIIGEELYMDLSDPEIGKYQWSPADNISCSTCPDPVFKAMETTAYSVAVTDVNECFTLSYPFNLTVEKKYSVDVPLAFTPNGDGINDKVFVKGWGLRELVMFRIFNRFGQVVYESTDIKEGWDGVYDGVPQPVETYTYIVRVRTEADEVLEKSGTLRLIR